VAQGTIRAVDPYIAARMLALLLCAASDLPYTIPDVAAAEAPALYISRCDDVFSLVKCISNFQFVWRQDQPY
jgi:hypothetical protein